MADFAKCDADLGESGRFCPFKYSCKRFTERLTVGAAPHVETWIKAPYREVTHSCAEFLPNYALVPLPAKREKAKP